MSLSVGKVTKNSVNLNNTFGYGSMHSSREHVLTPKSPSFKAMQPKGFFSLIKDFIGKNDTVYLDFVYTKEQKEANRLKKMARSKLINAYRQIFDEDLFDIIDDLKKGYYSAQCSVSSMFLGKFSIKELKSQSILNKVKLRIMHNALSTNKIKAKNYPKILEYNGVIGDWKKFRKNIAEYKMNKKLSEQFALKSNFINELAKIYSPNYNGAVRDFNNLNADRFYVAKAPVRINGLSDLAHLVRRKAKILANNIYAPKLAVVGNRIQDNEQEMLSALAKARKIAELEFAQKNLEKLK